MDQYRCWSFRNRAKYSVSKRVKKNQKKDESRRIQEKRNETSNQEAICSLALNLAHVPVHFCRSFEFKKILLSIFVRHPVNWSSFSFVYRVFLFSILPELWNKKLMKIVKKKIFGLLFSFNWFCDWSWARFSRFLINVLLKFIRVLFNLDMILDSLIWLIMTINLI